MKSDVQLRQQVSRIQLELNDLQTRLGGGSSIQPPRLDSPFPTLTPIAPATPPSAVNQVRNGEAGHSNDTWFNPPPGSSISDAGKECAWWFSNDPPFTGQILDFSISPANPNNHTLKAFIDDGGVHTTYNEQYCDWDRAGGVIRLTGDKTLDAPLPNNRVVVPNRPIDFFGCLIALRDNTIVVPSALRIFAGLWDELLGDWIAGAAPFVVNHSVRGTPTGTTERRYRILAHTDRGFNYLSEEEVVTDAPSDSSFSTADVLLSWQSIPGILEYKVYRFDVTAAKYRLLSEIGSGANTYVDNGSILNDDVGGYPDSTTNTPRAYVATQSQDLLNLPVDGQPWASLFLNIPVPSDYDSSLTTGEQVLRIGMTIPLDRRMIDARVTNGSTNLFSDSAVFTIMDVGREIEVSDGTNTLATTTAALVDAENVTMADAWAFANAVDATLYVTAGGDHGLLIDAIHLSYVSGSAFAPHPDDINRLANGGQNPITAPTSSSQGSAGGGGSTGGGEGGVTDPFGCVALDCPISILVGNSVENLTWSAVKVGDILFSGNLRPNQVLRKPMRRTTSLHLVRIKATWLYDIEVPCSGGHPIITNFLDSTGRAAENLRRGDGVLVSINGHVERKPIREIVDTGVACDVGTFSLYPNHIYSAGRVRWRGRLRRLLGRLFRAPAVGALCHNLKSLSEFSAF
jgi:hypothetical protein